MSALWAPEPERATPAAPRWRRRLRPVPPPAPRLARFPFLMVLIALFGFGMAGLLLLNTTLQNQAFAARTLNRQATELTYVQADLENQLAVLGAPEELARRATGLGLRPNPYPALLEVPSGKVIGKPTRVIGTENRSLVILTPTQIEAEKAAKAATKKAAAERKAAEQKARAEAKKKAEAEAAKKAAAEAKKKAEAEAKKKAEAEAATKAAAEAKKKAADRLAAKKKKAQRDGEDG